MPLKGIYLKAKEYGKTKMIDLITNLKTGSTAIRVDTGMHVSTFTEEYTGSQDNVELIAPEDSQKLCVRSVTTKVSGVAGKISLDFLGSSQKVHRHYTSQQNFSSTLGKGHIIGNQDEPLILNAPDLADNDLFVIVDYIEHL